MVVTWRRGLFDSCTSDGRLAAATVCCFPCTVGRVHAAATGHTDSVARPVCVATALALPAACVLPAVRWAVGRKYGIYRRGAYGDAAAAGCVAWLCPLCSVAQCYNELNARGTWPGGSGPCVPRPVDTNVFAGVDCGDYGAL